MAGRAHPRHPPGWRVHHNVHAQGCRAAPVSRNAGVSPRKGRRSAAYPSTGKGAVRGAGGAEVAFESSGSVAVEAQGRDPWEGAEHSSRWEFRVAADRHWS